MMENSDFKLTARQNSITSSILNEYDIVNGPEAPEETESGGMKKTNKNKKTKKEGEISTLGLEFEHEHYDSDDTQLGEISTHLNDDQEEISSRNVSPRTPYIRICPPINCKEKIIICLDLNEEMESTCFRSRAGDKYSSLELAKRAIKMFVMHKSQMNKRHEFAFMIFHEDATMIQNFSSKPEDLLRTLYDSEMVTQSSGPLNLGNLFQTIADNVRLPPLSENPQVIPPSYCVRLLLVYGRSRSIPMNQGKKVQRMLESSPCFFTDVLYIHEPVSVDNSCEDIFNRLCELDPIGLSYILEASKYTPIFNSAAKLLAHPLQRPLQDKANYKIGSLPIVPDIDERSISNY